MNQGGLKAIQLLLSTSFDLLHSEALDLLQLVSERDDYLDLIAESSLVEDLVRVSESSSEEVKKQAQKVYQTLLSHSSHSALRTLLEKPDIQLALSNTN